MNKLFSVYTVIICTLFLACNSNVKTEIPVLPPSYSDIEYSEDTTKSKNFKANLISIYNDSKTFFKKKDFINVEALQKIETAKIPMIKIGKEFMEGLDSNGIRTVTVYDKDGVNTIRIITGGISEIEDEYKKLMIEYYVREYFTDNLSPIFTGMENVKSRENFSAINNLLKEKEDLIILIIDNSFAELPEVIDGESFIEGATENKVLGIKLSTSEILFKINIKGRSSEEVKFTRFNELDNSAGLVEVDEDLFLSTQKKIVSKLNSELEKNNIAKEVYMYFDNK